MNAESYLKVEKAVEYGLICFDISFSMYIFVSNSIEEQTVCWQLSTKYM